MNKLAEKVFGGESYKPSRDKTALDAQLAAVRSHMIGHRGWYTLDEIATAVGLRLGAKPSTASVSARLRDLRKSKFGGYSVEKRIREGSARLWEYHLDFPKPGPGTGLAIVAGLAVVAIFYAFLLVPEALATYKPDYSKSPVAVRQWFKSATVPGWPEFKRCRDAVNRTGKPWPARKKLIDACGQRYSPAHIRLNLVGCCDGPDRLKTKFVPSRNGDWSYYPDPECTHAGCKLLPIPRDVVEHTPIEPRPGSLKGLNAAEIAKVRTIFRQMRSEGVLFIFNGKPSCFWAPQPEG